MMAPTGSGQSNHEFWWKLYKPMFRVAVICDGEKAPRAGKPYHDARTIYPHGG